MSPDRQRQLLSWSTRLCVLLALVVAGYAGWKLRPEPVPAAPSAAPRPELQPAPHIAAEAWRVLVPAASSVASSNAASATPQRFRLAGTFFAYGAGEVRRAILDDLQTKQQAIVGQGEEFQGYRVAEVGVDRAIMTCGQERIVLTLGFAGPGLSAATVATNAVGLAPEEKVLEETLFGKRVGENRWVLSRPALLAYYQDLVENPERIAALYLSLKPDYNNEEVAGYRLNQEGERDFFKAVGMREGDVVRRVNSMNMTSQARAEYFIGEFVKSRLNAVVIDMERDGKPEKLIYLLR